MHCPNNLKFHFKLMSYQINKLMYAMGTWEMLFKDTPRGTHTYMAIVIFLTWLTSPVDRDIYYMASLSSHSPDLTSWAPQVGLSQPVQHQGRYKKRLTCCCRILLGGAPSLKGNISVQILGSSLLCFKTNCNQPWACLFLLLVISGVK